MSLHSRARSMPPRTSASSADDVVSETNDVCKAFRRHSVNVANLVQEGFAATREANHTTAMSSETPFPWANLPVEIRLEILRYVVRYPNADDSLILESKLPEDIDRYFNGFRFDEMFSDSSLQEELTREFLRKVRSCTKLTYKKDCCEASDDVAPYGEVKTNFPKLVKLGLQYTVLNKDMVQRLIVGDDHIVNVHVEQLNIMIRGLSNLHEVSILFHIPSDMARDELGIP